MRFDEIADDPELVSTFSGVIVGGMTILPAGKHHINMWPELHGVDRTVVRDTSDSSMMPSTTAG